MNTVPQDSLSARWSELLGPAAQLQGPEWLRELRARAAESFAAHGLPHRKIEDWKYTPLKALESLQPALSGEAVKSPGSAAGSAPLGGADAPVIDITGARLAGALPSLKDGVSVASLTDALAAHGERLQKLVESVDFSGAGRAFAALNTACLEQALVVHVAAGVDAGRLLLRWTPAAGSDAVLANFRILLLLDQGARLQLLQQFGGADGAAQGLNVLVQAQLDREASLEEIRLQSEADASTLLTATGVEQAEASGYRYLGFDLGGGLVRHEFDIALAGPAALADLAGAFVLDGRRYVDNHISVDHAAADCRSEQFFRGVLGGRSRGVFNGRALIRPGADGSVVHQSNANLLLSGLAEMNTKPELEIYADEVEASHGATVGQLDESAVFYLRTRGLSDAQARRMLTTAFCRAVTDRLADRELAEQVGALLDAAMPEADERPGSG